MGLTPDEGGGTPRAGALREQRMAAPPEPTNAAAARRLAEWPRIPLAHLPTPLEPLPRLGEAFGVPHLWVKRDDCTGLATGGNKARKLEFLLAEAQAQGADTLITTGGAQSNHARMTVAAGNTLGMRSILALDDAEPEVWQGNLLLDGILGAEVRFVPCPTHRAIVEKLAEIGDEVRSAGRNPYIIPVGGSTPVGCLGYALAVQELAAQSVALGVPIDVCVSAVGSTGTLAGMLLGQRLFLPEMRVIGVSVASPSEVAKRKAAGIATEAAASLGWETAFTAEEIELYDDWLGEGYGIPTGDGLEVIRQAATLEGLLVDPVYTGKALAGLRGLAQRGEFSGAQNVLFWHTGGTAALFARPELFPPAP